MLEIDTILVGRTLTLDERGSIAGAVAISGDRIVAVGPEEDIVGQGGRARVLKTDGTIIPGFNDTHAHMDTEGLRTIHPSLETASTIGDVLERIAALASATPKGEWIVTMPVGKPPFYFGGPGALAEGRMPNRHELDRAAPDHPVCILPPSGYWSLVPCYTALNSRALALNGLDRTSRPTVPNIDIERDASGELTGVIVEHNYPASVQVDLMRAVPRFTDAERRSALLRSIAAYHAQGTTSVYEGHGCAPAIIDAYRSLRDADELTMRACLVVSPVWTTLEEAERSMRDGLSFARGQGTGDAFLRVSGVFISYGGDPSAAAVSQAHPDHLGWSCYLQQANDPETFEALCLLAARHDLRVHTIVIDKLHEIVPILERIDREFTLRGRRWVLEHVSATRAGDLARLAPLGVGVTLIPDYHVWKVGTRFFPLSEDERTLVSPTRQLSASGVPVAGGTDNSPCNPLASMRAMITRRERTTGAVIGVAGCADAELALRAMTCNGAWFTFEEAVKGRIKPGFLADIAVLSGDPLATPADELESLTCLATMVGGRFVHGGL